jgi:hypothetical protein
MIEAMDASRRGLWRAPRISRRMRSWFIGGTICESYRDSSQFNVRLLIVGLVRRHSVPSQRPDDSTPARCHSDTTVGYACAVEFHRNGDESGCARSARRPIPVRGRCALLLACPRWGPGRPCGAGPWSHPAAGSENSGTGAGSAGVVARRRVVGQHGVVETQRSFNRQGAARSRPAGHDRFISRGYRTDNLDQP